MTTETAARPSEIDAGAVPPGESSIPSSSPLLPRILSGSVGSIVTALAVTPLEVVKIRQQAAGAGGVGGASGAPNPANPARNIPPTLFRGITVAPCPGCGTLVMNNGLMDCVLPVRSTCLARPVAPAAGASAPIGGTFSTLMSIFRNEGYTGLYAGLRPTLVMSVPNTVLYFSAYDEISGRLRNGNSENSNNSNNNNGATRQAYIPLVAGSAARLLASLVTAPLELVRTRQASVVSNSENPIRVPGMAEEFRLLLRTNGAASLYAGLAPTLWRDVPFSAIYWLFLERFRDALSESDQFGILGGAHYRERGVKIPPGVEASHAFVSGAAAGSIAAALTTPFDVVKTRRQMVNGGAESAATNSCDCPPERGAGTFDHMRQIVRREGVPGLWKGNATRMVKVAPACAIMISCYEFGKRVFGEVL